MSSPAPAVLPGCYPLDNGLRMWVVYLEWNYTRWRSHPLHLTHEIINKCLTVCICDEPTMHRVLTELRRAQPEP